MPDDNRDYEEKEIEEIEFDIEDPKEDAYKGLTRTPHEKGVDYVPTNEPTIYKKFIDGVFQNKYIVSMTLGRSQKLNKYGEIYLAKETKKETFNSFQEAVFFRDALRQKRNEYKKSGKVLKNHQCTIEEVIEDFEKYMEKDGRSEDYISDKVRYGKHAKLFFTKANNNLDKIAHIENGNINEYLLYLKNEKNYSHKTLEKERAYIHQLWDFMLMYPKKYDVSVNVANNARIPEDGKTKYKSRDLTYLEIEELIKEACQFDDPSFLYLVVFSITQGLRRGELCGLQWGDINFDKKVVTIKHNRVQTVASGRDKLKKPKTERIRDIELHKVGYETLALYKNWQEKYLGRKLGKDEFVLRYEVNLKYDYPPHTGKISRKWKETCHKINKNREKQGKAAIPYGRIHDGRHVYASMLLNGVKKEDGSIVSSASYIQVYASMGHSLPKALANTTTTIYNEDIGERFEVTRFWNELLSVDVKKEWKECQKKYADLPQIKKDILAEQKRKRMEKANQERLKAKSPKEEVINYTEDGELSGFEEDNL